MRLLRTSDAINRLRFKGDGKLLAAWDSARNVAWPTTTAAEPPAKSPPIAPAA